MDTAALSFISPQAFSARLNQPDAQTPREVVVYCVYGHQVSVQAAALLTGLGWQAHVLAGGFMGGEDCVDSPNDIAAWRAHALPLTAKPDTTGAAGVQA